MEFERLVSSQSPDWLLTSSRQVRNLGERIRLGHERPTDMQALDQFRGFLLPPASSIMVQIQEGLHDLPHLMAGRVKRLESIRRKLTRQHRMKLENMDDVVGLRILAPSPSAQEELLPRVSEILEALGVADLRIRRYDREPSPSGYRAIHIIPQVDLQLDENGAHRPFGIEIQLRTFYQHLWSSTSESFGEQVKEGGGSEPTRKYLAELSQKIAVFEDAQPESPQMDIESHTGSLTHFLLTFDRQTLNPPDVQRIGPSAKDALRVFKQVEANDFSRNHQEAVLLTCQSEGHQLRRTHLRYFAPRGVPDLPSELVPQSPRPPERWIY